MEASPEIVLSVVTPVYNRAAELRACFQSLVQQTVQSFEWIVVNDGSTDETADLLQTLAQAATAFPIIAVNKENGGKHTALNAAQAYIRGRYVLILDSDDSLTADAVEQTLLAWSRWAAHPEVGVVTLLKGKDCTHPNCYAAEENRPVDILSHPRICPVSQDACEVIRKELFLQYPFPVFPGERFLAETALWGRVSQSHKCVYVNRVIYLCDYQADGLTRAGRALQIRNPRGGMFNANLYLASLCGWKIKLKNALLYTCYGRFAGLSARAMARECANPALMWVCLPLGWLLYRYWNQKYGGSAT